MNTELNSPADGASARASVLRMLVIDDDEVDRMRVARMLRQIPEWQVEVEVAVDKASGMAAICERQFDCVLLDYRLPDGEGIDLLKELNAKGRQLPPIIVETVLDDDETALRTLAAGAQDYLVKGRFDAGLLRRSIRYAIQRNELLLEKERLLCQLKETLAKVQTLEGLLPTCAWCKRIRDKTGNWHSFEAYIVNHSKAELTHGICSDCAKKQGWDS